MIDLFKPFVSNEASMKVAKTLSSGFIGQGPIVEELEQILRDWFKNDHVNTVNSGTSGIHLALHLLKNRDGRDEVLTTPLTCTATNWPILANNYKIRWVDVDPYTCNMCLEDLESKINSRTRAIMVVHWGGLSCDLYRLKRIAGEIPIIEDCAHAWGASFNGQLIGNHGNICVFSFQAIKHFTTGDGGCLICPDKSMHEKAKLLRWYGFDRNNSHDFRCQQTINDWGFKFHMNDINASIGVANFPYAAEIVQKHKNNGEFFNKYLQNIPGVKLLKHDGMSDSSYWIYTLRVDKRADFIKMMQSAGIAVSQVHDRNDKHGCVAECRTFLPGLDVLSKEMICIPCGWWLTEENRNYIVETIKKGW